MLASKVFNNNKKDLENQVQELAKGFSNMVEYYGNKFNEIEKELKDINEKISKLEKQIKKEKNTEKIENKPEQKIEQKTDQQ